MQRTAIAVVRTSNESGVLSGAASGKNQILSEVHMPQFFLRR
jgi:hypothetical protein